MKKQNLLILLFLPLLLSSCHYRMNEPEGTDKGHYFGDFEVENSHGLFSMSNVEVSVTSESSEGKYSIMFHDVKFSEAMPLTLDIIVPGVEIDKNGVIYGNHIIPIAKDEPFEQYEVTGLSGTYTNETLELNLCFGAKPTHFIGTRHS